MKHAVLLYNIVVPILLDFHPFAATPAPRLAPQRATGAGPVAPLPQSTQVLPELSSIDTLVRSTI